MTGEIWRTIDFRPAAPGWRLIGLKTEGGWYDRPLPGWLIQERAELDHLGEVVALTDAPAEDRDRQIVAAFDECGYPMEAYEYMTGFWYVAGPGEPDPTTQDVAQAQESKRQSAEATKRVTTTQAKEGTRS